MSKGGAGKVYFVLYLAVVLELLIIIVERDEAEEHLHQKQKEAMKIVQSILSQLQAGSGTEGINTRPQDEITIPPPGVNIKEVLGTDIKPYRQYVVDVGVSDVSIDAKKKEGEAEKDYLERLKTLVKLANVAEIEYEIFYNNSQETGFVPPFPSDDWFKNNDIDFSEFEPGNNIIDEEMGAEWKFLGSQRLFMNDELTYDAIDKKNAAKDPMHPVYTERKMNGPAMSPPGVPEDSIFYYSPKESLLASGIVGTRGTLDKRAFVVNFQPPNQAGWYKLRFVSRTNRILGVRATEKVDDLDDKATVNIGTVQLKIKDLKTVKKELEIKLDKYNVPEGKLLTEPNGLKLFDEKLEAAKDLASNEMNAVEVIGNIRLYGYIVKLLTPGQSANFDQNRGSIEYNIRVMTPKPKIAEPVINMVESLTKFDQNKINFSFNISPYQGDANQIIGTVHTEEEGPASTPVARINIRPANDINITGGTKEYYGEIDRPLEAGANGGPRRYIVKMVHALQGKSEEKQSTLSVFPALVEEKINTLKIQVNAYAEYGQELFFNFEPPSGNKIQAEQFGYYFQTDADPQERGLVRGLSAAIGDGLRFESSMNQASLRIVWIDPITEEETDIFPKETFEISQPQPKVSTINQQDNIVVDGEMIRIRITGIKITAPRIGFGDNAAKATVNSEIGNPTVKIPGFSVVGKPKITIKDETAQIDITLSGEPDDDGWVKGVVEIPITVSSTNPLNGKTSKPRQQKLSVNVRQKPEVQDGFNQFDNW